MGRVNEAVRDLVKDNGREGGDDTLLIRLFGRTGVCLEQLQPDTVSLVI